MHRYSINSRKREEVIKNITIVSFSVGVIIAVLEVSFNTLNIFKMESDNVIWILLIQMLMTLFPITLYEVLMLLYRKVIWKKVVAYHKIPDLNGKWEGELKSELKGTSRKITIEIQQNWDEININTYTDKNAQATSTVAEIKVDDSGRVYLSYAFENIRLKDSYIGFNCLQCRDDELFGEYFTSKTIGKEICESLGINEKKIQELIATGMGSKGTLRVKRLNKI